MKNFKQFKRTQIAEMREVTENDITDFHNVGAIVIPSDLGDWKHPIRVSISDADLLNDSPKIGDMIARNPKNHFDQWLVAEQYFKDNFEPFCNESLDMEKQQRGFSDDEAEIPDPSYFMQLGEEAFVKNVAENLRAELTLREKTLWLQGYLLAVTQYRK